MTRSSTNQQPFGFAGSVWLLLAALFVAGAVLSILSVPEDPTPFPELDLVDGAGRPFELSQLYGQTWVAAFAGANAAGDALSDLAAALPEPVALVTFVIPDKDALPAPALNGGGLRVGGSRETLMQLAQDHFGFSADDVQRAVSGNAYLVTSLDRTGRVSTGHVAGSVDAGRMDPDSKTAVVSQVDFLLSLTRRPQLHAFLNGLSAVWLSLGYLCIRNRRIGLHLTCMLLAVATTLCFLWSYLYYHFHAGSTSFTGVGWPRPLYFGLLLSHTVLAAFVVPLAATVLFHAARRNLDRHRRLARWTLPIWLYVSVTGVLIYFMLHVWF